MSKADTLIYVGPTNKALGLRQFQTFHAGELYPSLKEAVDADPVLAAKFEKVGTFAKRNLRSSQAISLRKAATTPVLKRGRK